ncbi:MAG: ATP-binding protein [Acidimicrobiales bacterium]
MTALMFPFSAVVGQDDAKLALTLAAAEPALGGVLLRGHKGSAKTTLARALASLLPGEGRFVELPVGATEDRVVGSVDLAAALTGGEIRFRPGLVAAAHGGVLYVDEINLLADHLVDVLLDVAVSGVNRVEREGISHAHPSRFVLVGSMNPEEGDLRPQLLDRFGLAVDVTTETDPAGRAEAVRRRMAFDADPESFHAQWGSSESELGAHIRGSVRASLDDEIVGAVSTLCASVGAEGLRADLVICRAAAALAGLEGRRSTTFDDVRRVAPLALAHRRRRHPLDPPGVSPEELDSALGSVDSTADPANGQGAPDRVAGPGPVAPTAPLLQAPRAESGAAGRRSVVQADRGRLVGDRAPEGGALGSVAVGATLRAAAVRRSGEPRSAVTSAVQLVQAGDVREAVRETRAGNLVVFAVDASGSMGAERRMEAAKGAVLGLLVDAYQRRDRVALVTFRGDGAEVVLRPTGSVEVAKARLADVPMGGRTPLAAGIQAALDIALTAERQNGDGGHRPLLVLVSDGRATNGPPGRDPLDAARQSAASVRRRRIPAVVIDAEEGRSRLGLAAELAELMGARYLTLGELSVAGLRSAADGST